jgi:rhodanese-related sulfurtransferase
VVALQILLLIVLTAVLTRILRQSRYAEGLRTNLSSRSRLLEKLFRCPHCLSFWIAAAGTAVFLVVAHLSLVEFALFILLGWRGAYYLNRLIDTRRDRDRAAVERKVNLVCPVCSKPYDESFLERNTLYFCSHTCWFDYLKNRPKSYDALYTSKGEFVRQETYPMSYTDITPEEAKELLDNGGYTYVDVRSEPEFRNGHPADSVNVPVMHREPMGMVPNPDFLRVMEINFEHHAPLILGCQSGARSARAAEAMLAVGFSAVHNVTGGFGGARDDSGAILQKGWFELGLPVDYGDPEDRNYAAMSGGR